MASLKEIKGRIGSVKSTQKITSAMKMISSAKLHKAQNKIENFLPYEQKLHEILNNYISSSDNYSTPLSEVRDEIRKVTLVVITSNSSLCGAFNSNIINIFAKTYKEYIDKNIAVETYVIGKKIEDNIKNHFQSIEYKNGFNHIVDNPNFDVIKQIANEIISNFLAKRSDRVLLIYNHFKSVAVQVPTKDMFLPLVIKKEETATNQFDNYLVEPSKSELLDVLLPKSLTTKLYSVLLDSAAAEQAARMVAMQIATDNADELLKELSIQFNNQRQQSITSELLDIIGGSESLK